MWLAPARLLWKGSDPRPPRMAPLKQLAREIFHSTLAAIDIRATLERKLARTGSRITVGDETVDLAAFARVAAIACPLQRASQRQKPSWNCCAAATRAP